LHSLVVLVEEKMQTRREGLLTLRKGTRTLHDGIRTIPDAVITINEGAGIFTYKTTNEGEINGGGKIYIHINFKPVGGTIASNLIVIYYPKDNFILPVIFGELHNPPQSEDVITGELT
jgi:hypothetical protein